jgi:hypothetical protein
MHAVRLPLRALPHPLPRSFGLKPGILTKKSEIGEINLNESEPRNIILEKMNLKKSEARNLRSENRKTRQGEGDKHKRPKPKPEAPAEK